MIGENGLRGGRCALDWMRRGEKNWRRRSGGVLLGMVLLGVGSWAVPTTGLTHWAEEQREQAGTVGPDGRFLIGRPVLTDLWVDPLSGDDSRSGNSLSLIHI